MAKHKEENKEDDEVRAGEEGEKGYFTCYREDIEVCIN